MTKYLEPGPALLAKLVSIAVHADEFLSDNGHAFDRTALQSLLADPDVVEWTRGMGEMGLLPKKRD